MKNKIKIIIKKLSSQVYYVYDTQKNIYYVNSIYFAKNGKKKKNDGTFFRTIERKPINPIY